MICKNECPNKLLYDEEAIRAYIRRLCLKWGLIG